MAVKLACKNLGFSYGAAPMLKDVNLTLESGTFMAVLGRNGSGKTTLLHCLNRLNPHASGTVHINGQDIHSLSRKQIARQVSLVVQEHPEVFPFTVLDVVVMGRAPFLGFSQVPTEKDYSLAMEALATLDATHLAGSNFNRISGGERQLSLLAAALVQTRDIILLDEPTNHLDFKNKYLLLSQVRRLCSRDGTAVVAAMHDPNMAVRFADKVALLKNGSLFAQGPVHHVMTTANMDYLYDTKTTCLALANDGHFFIPTEILDDSR